MWCDTRITYIHGFAVPTKHKTFTKKTFPHPPLAPTDDVAVSSWSLQFACSLCSYQVHEDETWNMFKSVIIRKYLSLLLFRVSLNQRNMVYMVEHLFIIYRLISKMLPNTLSVKPIMSLSCQLGVSYNFHLSIAVCGCGFFSPRVFWVLQRSRL